MSAEFLEAKKHHCKSHSHILSLSLLLLLAAGDISPNPGPSLISTCFQPRSTPRAKNTRKTQNLIPITCHKPSTLPFSCALWNARSICNKLTFTHDLFTTNSLNLLALTETWLSSSDTASPAALSHGGFHLSHTPRPGNKQGGGVGVLLSSRCTFHLIPPVPSLQFSSFEAHTIRLFSPISLRVAVIYRPPGTSSQFLDHFSAWLPHFLSSNIPTLILGDFNIAIDTPTSSAAAKLLALTSSLGLSQLTDSSTHHAELMKLIINEEEKILEATKVELALHLVDIETFRIMDRFKDYEQKLQNEIDKFKNILKQRKHRKYMRDFKDLTNKQVYRHSQRQKTAQAEPQSSSEYDTSDTEYLDEGRNRYSNRGTRKYRGRKVEGSTTSSSPSSSFLDPRQQYPEPRRLRDRNQRATPRYK
ncbi:uncharacterized protein O3C94_002789 [Discoglossus pictus]